jgi:hypothetical protein
MGKFLTVAIESDRCLPLGRRHEETKPRPRARAALATRSIGVEPAGEGCARALRRSLPT